MKKIILIIAIFYSVSSFSQTNKVAILDFENTSGKSEYDALGKSLSNMLIADLKNNIHPKKVEFYERAQLNKLLEEQKLQKSKNFDAKTAVDFGKLSGVNYVFVGAVFVLEGNCNISSKLVDVRTSKILITKEVNGKIESWLSLKSELAETIAKELNNPITLGSEYKTVNTSLSTLNQYGKILTTMDGGDAEKAEQLRSVFEETNPDFKYFKDIKEDIEELKKQVEKNTADIEILNKSGGRIINAKSFREHQANLSNSISTFSERKESLINILKSYGNSLSNEEWRALIAYPEPKAYYFELIDFEILDSIISFYKLLLNCKEINNEIKIKFISCSVNQISKSKCSSVFIITKNHTKQNDFEDYKNKLGLFLISVFSQIDNLSNAGLNYESISILKLIIINDCIKFDFDMNLKMLGFSRLSDKFLREIVNNELDEMKNNNSVRFIADTASKYLNELTDLYSSLCANRNEYFLESEKIVKLYGYRPVDLFFRNKLDIAKEGNSEKIKEIRSLEIRIDEQIKFVLESLIIEIERPPAKFKSYIELLGF